VLDWGEITYKEVVVGRSEGGQDVDLFSLLQNQSHYINQVLIQSYVIKMIHSNRKWKKTFY